MRITIKKIFLLHTVLVVISIVHAACRFNERGYDRQEKNTEIFVENETESTDKPELQIKKIVAIPQSIKPGYSTQLILHIDSNCPPTTPEEIHQKCHNNCTQGLEYTWTSTCSGYFDDINEQHPVFTAASEAAIGPCTLSVLVKNKCSQLSTSTTISIIDEVIINESPEILSTFQSSDIVMTGEDIVFIVRARDPEGTALSFTWLSTSGYFGEPIESITENYSESYIQWTSPDCGEEPVEATVYITDADRKFTKYTYIPIKLLNGEACQ